jgi:hypothetical protein
VIWRGFSYIVACHDLLPEVRKMMMAMVAATLLFLNQVNFFILLLTGFGFLVLTVCVVYLMK